MEIRLPNGVILKNVPNNVSKADIKLRAIASGVISEEEFGQSPEQATPVSETTDTGFSMATAGRGTQDAPGPLNDENYEAWQAKYDASLKEEDDQSMLGAIASDIGTSLTPEELGNTVETTAGAVGNVMGSIAGAITNLFGGDGATVKRNFGIATGAALSAPFAIFGDEGYIEVDEHGNYVADKPSTVAGQIYPYLIPGAGATKFFHSMGWLAKLSPAVRASVAATAGGTVADQIISDPYADNVANYLGEVMDEGTAKEVVNYMANQDDDPESVRRLKLLGQDLIFSTAFGAVGGFYQLAKRGGSTLSQKFIKEGGAALTPEERGKVFLEGLDAWKDHHLDGLTASKNNMDSFHLDDLGGSTTPPAGVAPTPPQRPTGSIPDAELAQLYKQSADRATTPEAMRAAEEAAKKLDGGWAGAVNRFIPPVLDRLRRQVFTSRGYWTPTMDALKQKSVAEQRAITGRAGNIATRINLAMERVANEITDNPQAGMDSIVNSVDAAIKGDAEMLARLPRPLQVEVGYARQLIDSLSRNLIDSPTIHREFKDDIAAGVGQYMRRSYAAFTNPDYKPSQAAIDSFLDRSTKDILEASPAKTLAEAAEEAQGRMDDILDKTGEGFSRHFGAAARLNNSIYSRRKEVPDYVKNLLGEIRSPSDNIILTVNKLVQYTETDKFTRNILDLGSNKFLFESRRGVFSQEITGTNSALDGQFTTPELVRALQDKQSVLIDPKGDSWYSAWLREAAFVKGGVQSLKTIYSPVTHLKNIQGALLSRLANGSNPFGNTGGVYDVLKNQVAQGGDTALDDLAEKYLRLGITSTSVKANEIKELLETAIANPNNPSKLSELTERYLTKNLPDSVTSTPQQVYSAVDDFVKISQFHSEVDTLRQAFPEQSIDEIEKLAAEKVRTTMFNYDKVPNAIKRLRNVPMFGNFVSFSSEAFRSSIGIFETAYRETTSGNAVMRNRGIRRMTGLVATAGFGYEGISMGAGYIGGFTRDEMAAMQVLSETPYSPNPIIIPIRDEETGRIYKADATTLDPYEPIRSPLKGAYIQLLEGTMSEKKATEIMGDMIGAFYTNITKPYFEPSIAEEARETIVSAWNSEDGVSTSGKRIFAPGMTTGEKLNALGDVMFDVFAPGVLNSAATLYEETANATDQFTNRPNTPGLAVASLAGLTWGEYDPEQSLKFLAGDYAAFKRRSDRVSVNYRTKPEEVLANYESINHEYYRQQQEMFRKVQAVMTLGLPTHEVVRILDQNGITPEERQAAMAGEFRPFELSDDILKQIEQKVYHKGNTQEMPHQTFLNEYVKKRNSMLNRDLERFEVEDERPMVDEGVRMLRGE